MYVCVIMVVCVCVCVCVFVCLLLSALDELSAYWWKKLIKKTSVWI